MAEVLCDDDEGVQDFAQALQWCRKAAEQHDPEGEMLLGQMYREGRGAARDPAAAFSWYSKAAAQGVVIAEYWVGSMYHEGAGVKQDLAKAIEWLKRSADQGYELASTPGHHVRRRCWRRKGSDQGHCLFESRGGSGTARSSGRSGKGVRCRTRG